MAYLYQALQTCLLVNSVCRLQRKHRPVSFNLSSSPRLQQLSIKNGPSTAVTNECTICVTPTCEATTVADTSDTRTTEQKKEAPIWIYVDDSNIWIEAKKHASKMRQFKTKEDHRV